MRPCADCPFLRSTPLVGSADWLQDVYIAHVKDPFFNHSCHKTDPNADGYVKGKRRECGGHQQMIMNERDETPGMGGVYNSVRELIETYLTHWLGEKELNKIKRKVLGNV